MPLDPFGCLLGGLCSQQDGLYSGSCTHRLSYSGQFPSLSRWGMTLVCPVASKKPWRSRAGTLTGSLRVLSVGGDDRSFRLTQWRHEAPSSTGPDSHKVCPLKSRSCGYSANPAQDITLDELLHWLPVHARPPFTQRAGRAHSCSVYDTSFLLVSE